MIRRGWDFVASAWDRTEDVRHGLLNVAVVLAVATALLFAWQAKDVTSASHAQGVANHTLLNQIRDDQRDIKTLIASHSSSISQQNQYDADVLQLAEQIVSDISALCAASDAECKTITIPGTS